MSLKQYKNHVLYAEGFLFMEDDDMIYYILMELWHSEPVFPPLEMFAQESA